MRNWALLFLSLCMGLLLLTACGDGWRSEEYLPSVTSEQGQPDQAKTAGEGMSQEEEDDSDRRIPAKIIKVVDGDTVEIEWDGKEEKVRLLLVDTPETVHPSKPVEPFGPEASQFAKDTLTDKEVELEMDVSERDKYGRLLAYLWVDDRMFNEMLLEKGLARVAYVYPPNVKHVDRFREIQKEAQLEGIGIWSIEDYAREDGFNREVVMNQDAVMNQRSARTTSRQDMPADSSEASGGTSSPAGEAPAQDPQTVQERKSETAPENKTEPEPEPEPEPESSSSTTAASSDACSEPTIKGNHSSSGELIYHVPGGQFYDKTKPEEMFCTEDEAIEAGYRKSKR